MADGPTKKNEVEVKAQVMPDQMIDLLQGTISKANTPQEMKRYLQERFKTLQFSKEQRKEVLDRVGTLESIQKNEGAKEALQELIKNDLASLKENIIDPRTWSPETKETVIKTSVAIGALAIIGIIGHKILSGAQKAGAKVKEGWGWFKKTVIIGGGLAILGGLAYFGIPQLREWVEGIKTLKDAKDMYDKKMAELDQIMQQGIGKTQEGVAAVKAKKEELTKWYEAKKEEFKNKKADAPPPTSVQKVTETAESATETVLFSKLFLEFFGDEAERAGISDVFDDEQARSLSDVIEAMNTLTLGDAEDGTDENIYNKLFVNGDQNFYEKRLRGIKLVRSILREHRAFIEKQYRFLRAGDTENKYTQDLKSVSVKKVLKMLADSEVRQAAQFVEQTAPAWISIIPYFAKGGTSKPVKEWLESMQGNSQEFADHEWGALFEGMETADKKSVDKKKLAGALFSGQRLSEVQWDTGNCNPAEQKFLTELTAKLQKRFADSGQLDPFLDQVCLSDPRITADLQKRFGTMYMRDAVQLYLACEHENLVGATMKILHLLKEDEAAFVYASSKLSQWAAKSVAGVVGGSVLSSTALEWLIQPGKFPPAVERVQRMLTRRAMHEAKSMAQSTTGFLGSIDASDFAIAGAGTVVGVSAIEVVKEHIFGTIEIVEKRGGKLMRPWHWALGLTSDYHLQLYRDLGNFQRQWHSMCEQIKTIKEGGSSIRLAIEEFIQSAHKETDCKKLVDHLESLKLGKTQKTVDDLTNIITRLEQDIFPLETSLSHATRWLPTQIRDGLKKIIYIDAGWRLDKVQSFIAKDLADMMRNKNLKFVADELDAFLDLAGRKISLKEAHIIWRSEKAKEMLVDAMKTSDVAKLNSILKTARRAAVGGAVWKTLGIAGDIFSFVLLQGDQADIEALADQTDTKALQEALLKQSARTALAQSLPVLTAGGTILHTAIAIRTGAGFLGGMAAGSAVYGPVGILVAAGSITIEQAHELERQLLMEYKDFAKLPPAIQLGMMGNFPNAPTWNERIGTLYGIPKESLQGINEMQRDKILRTYMLQSTEAKPWPGETPQQTMERHKSGVSHSMNFLANRKKAGERYLQPAANELRNARLHGELFQLSLTLINDEKEQPEKMHATLDVKAKDGKTYKVRIADYAYLDSNPLAPYTQMNILKAYEEKQTSATATTLGEFATYADTAEKKSILRMSVAQLLIRECRDNINVLASKLETTDYDGMLWRDQETKERCILIAKDMIASQILQETDKLIATPGVKAISPAEYSRSLTSIQKSIEQIDTLQVAGRTTAPETRHIVGQEHMPILSTEAVLQSILQRNNADIESKNAPTFDVSKVLAERKPLQGDSEGAFLRNAEGYRLLPMKDGIVTGMGDQKTEIVISSNAPQRIPPGRYAIYSSKETLEKGFYRKVGSLGTIEIFAKESTEKIAERDRLASLRLKEGTAILQQAGATKIADRCYRINWGVFNFAPLFYFDTAQAHWIISKGPWGGTNADILRFAISGKYNLEPGQDPVKAGFDPRYESVIRDMQRVNAMKNQEKKKSIDPESPSSPNESSASQSKPPAA